MHEAIDTWEKDGVECNLYVDYGGDMFDPRDNDNLGTFVCREHRSYYLPQEIKGFKFEDFDSIDEAIDYLKENHGAVHIYPVWMYDHSSVSYSMGERVWPYTCPWDSSICGVIFTTKARMDEYGITDRSEEKIKEWLNGEIEEYSSWASGNVYYFAVDTPDGDGESCGGLIGYEYAHDEAERTFEFELNHYIQRRDKEIIEREYWESRDVITV